MLHWYNLMWYGPASAAMVVQVEDLDPVLTASGRARSVLDVTAAAEGQVRATMVRSSGMLVDAASDVEMAAKGRARAVLDVDISARPSADDIAQAVWGAALTITEESGTMARAMKVMASIAANRVVTNPSTGKFVVYDDDNTTILVQGDLWQDAAGSTPYAGAGAERRDRLI